MSAAGKTETDKPGCNERRSNQHRGNENIGDGIICNEDSFVSRWSRRKHESKYGIKKTAADKSAAEILESAERQQAPVKILSDDDMPDIESLTPDSDYAGFLSPGVSETLRKLALRKLFCSEAFNVCDGLDDYDDDYTQFKILGNTLTADMRHQAELKAQRVAEKLLQDKEKSHGYGGDEQVNVIAESDISRTDQDEAQQNESAENKARQSLSSVDAPADTELEKNETETS